MSDKTKIGIIGAGAIAQISHLNSWSRLENAEVVAICDINKKKAEWVSDKFDIPHSFDNADELLRIDEIQAVDICTPTQSHMPLAVSALSAGKHVLVEKPIARNYEEGKKMVDCAREYQKILMVAMNVRFRQDALILDSFTRNGELGELFYAKTGWLRRKEKMLQRSWLSKKEMSGGGVFMDLGIQMLDVGLWLMGNHKAESVKASTYNKISQLEVEDAAAAFIRLE
ncbi:MAG: Gfo/Idh/MocA family protein, partial [bacterium]